MQKYYSHGEVEAENEGLFLSERPKLGSARQGRQFILFASCASKWMSIVLELNIDTVRPVLKFYIKDGFRKMQLSCRMLCPDYGNSGRCPKSCHCAKRPACIHYVGSGVKTGKARSVDGHGPRICF